MKMIDNKNDRVIKDNNLETRNKKSIFALLIYVFFILTFELFMGVGFSDVWDRVSSWSHKKRK